jgi:hypothetical protein
VGFRSLQHVRNPRSTHAGSPTRYVPPSGFGYPRDGLLPSIPCRFCFTPAALMGFTLRSIALSKGIRGVTTRMHPLTVPPIGAPAAETVGRPNGPRFLGFDPSESPWRPDKGLVRRPLDAPLGFALPGSSRESLAQAFTRAPLTRFAPRGDRSPSAPTSQSLNQLSPGPIPSLHRSATTHETTLLGFLHRLNPLHAGELPTGLCVHLSLRRTSLPPDQRSWVG